MGFWLEGWALGLESTFCNSAFLSKVDSRFCVFFVICVSLPLLDSRIVDEKGLLCVLFSATCSRKDWCCSLGLLWDSKIFALEMAFFKSRVGDKTDGLSSSRGAEIAVSSQKS